jgi:predicted extracellular nuclease
MNRVPVPTALRRFTVLALALALATTSLPRGAAATTGDPVLLNEVLVSTTGTDVEFSELYGTPGTSLGGLSIITVESDTGTSYGRIDSRFDFAAGATLGGNGYYLVGNGLVVTAYGVTPDASTADNFYENSSLTIALVQTSSVGAVGTTVTGSEVVLDAVALVDSVDESGVFGAPNVGPEDGVFLPAGVHRVTTGVDTDTPADWELGDFNLGPDNTPTAATALGNQPVVVDCGADITILEGSGATREVTASDLDGTVTSISLDAVTPSDPGTFSLGATTPAPGTGGTASAELTVGGDTPAGSYQLTLLASNTDAAPQTGECALGVTVTEVLTVGAVQGQTTDLEDGTQDASPYDGESVWLRGVVTQRMRYNVTPSSSNPTGVQYAFFLQSTIDGSDGDDETSDGILVWQNRFTTLLGEGRPSYFPVVGDQVVLHGSVTEFFGLTEMSNPRVVAVERSGDDAVDLDTEVEMTEANPPDDLSDANRYWERHEGMLFHVPSGAQVVAARDVFPSTADGEVWVIRGDHPLANRTDAYAELVYRDPHPLDDIGPAGSFDNGNGMRILLQSHGLKWNEADPAFLIAPARTYDTVVNVDGLTGALYYSFGKYGVEVEQQLELANGVDPALNAPPSAVVDGVEFATSDYNVENLYDFRDDPFDGCDFSGNTGCPGVSPPFDYVPASLEAYQKHVDDLADQILGPMHAPDLLMIQEAEDQDICWVDGDELACGTTDDADGKPDTLQDLALAISELGGPTYDAAYDRDGADDRGIVSAFLYRTDRVELLAADAGDPVLGTSPTVDYRGDPLGYNVDVQNPKALNADLPSDVDTSTSTDGSNVFTRPPQVGHFRVWRDGVGSSVFTDLYAISNHFSSTPDRRVGQRTEQAAYNAAIVEALEAAGFDRVVSAGDFNVYPRPDDPFAPGQPYGCCSVGPSDQLGPMYDAGLHNLYDTLLAEVPVSAYSYSFSGQVQTLDTQWATDAQFADLVQVRAAHVNADFAADHDGDVGRGASDHDPQLARWFNDVTIDRLHALVDYYVASGQLAADKAFLFHDRLDKAAAYLEAGKMAAYRAQLQAFGNQAYDYATPAAAAALESEADRLAAL